MDISDSFVLPPRAVIKPKPLSMPLTP